MSSQETERERAMESTNPSHRDKIIDKIKKCMALSRSSNEHEAAAALRQARSLMEKHRVTNMDMLAAQVNECAAKSDVKNKPTAWQGFLAFKVGLAFDCRIFFVAAIPWIVKSKAEWLFIGRGAAPEIAQYTFTVLCRQAKRQRRAYIQATLRWCSPAEKTRRADFFSAGWVDSVAGKIEAFAGTDSESAIAAYVDKHYGMTSTLKVRDRKAGRNFCGLEANDFMSGSQAGKDVQLHRGVGAADRLPALAGPAP